MIIDTNSSCIGKTKFLKQKGVTAVGRYYRIVHPEWAVTKKEAQELSAAGIKLFIVFENHGTGLQLTKQQGLAGGKEALKQAQNIGQPQDGVIYFATEGLPSGYKSSDLPAIQTYFDGVKQGLAGKYTMGVYSDGVVCKTLLENGTCSHTWLTAASYSFEGTIEFNKSKKWNIAQVAVDIEKKHPKDWDGLSVDIDEVQGDFGSFFVPVPAQVA
jgi:hypothetical protein